MHITNVRDIVKRKEGVYDCIITTEKYGELPFTVTSEDSEAHGQELYQQIISGAYGNIPDYVEPPLSNDVKIEIIKEEVQRHLDDTARAMGYDDIRSAITYAEEPAVPRYQQEGQALRSWRSLCWSKCEELLADWQAGTIPEQTPAEVIAQLPVFTAP